MNPTHINQDIDISNIPKSSLMPPLINPTPFLYLTFSHQFSPHTEPIYSSQVGPHFSVSLRLIQLGQGSQDDGDYGMWVTTSLRFYQ